MNDQQIEKEIQAKGLTAPRVTPDDIEANIVAEFFFTASEGAYGGDYCRALDLLTFCVLVLRNGFTVTGESACASPENFDADLGRKIARQNAVNKIWPLMGYELKERLWLGAAKSMSGVTSELLGQPRVDLAAPDIDQAARAFVGGTFGQALDHLKRGGKVARVGWNGRGMWLALQRPDLNSKMSEPYVYMRTAHGGLIPWLASQADMLATDWYSVE